MRGFCFYLYADLKHLGGIRQSPNSYLTPPQSCFKNIPLIPIKGDLDDYRPQPREVLPLKHYNSCNDSSIFMWKRRIETIYLSPLFK